MLPVSMVQGSKLSRLLYSLFTIDTLHFNKLMKNETLYKKITGKHLQKYKFIRHKTLTYVDDTQHEDNESLRNYIQDSHILLNKIKCKYLNLSP